MAELVIKLSKPQRYSKAPICIQSLKIEVGIEMTRFRVRQTLLRYKITSNMLRLSRSGYIKNRTLLLLQSVLVEQTKVSF